MELTAAQRLAHAEAAARRWERQVEALALSDACDELFCLVHRSWMEAENHVRRLRADLEG